MSEIFLKVLNLSISASWLILAVVIGRPFLKKAPKWANGILWVLVALRLVCPFSLKSDFSLIPSAETIPYDIAMQRIPSIDTGISAVNAVINPVIAGSFTPDPMSSANPLRILIPLASIIWIIGILILLLNALVSFLRLKKSVGASIEIKKDIKSCDEVKSPFILGIFHPVIYVPSYMNGDTLSCVIIHENAHIRRRDHWWKPLGYLLLAMHWFNPLCWLAYILLCRDIEMACDEKVIRDMDKDGKAAYAQALLNCSFPKKKISVCPVAFGEIGVQERIKTVLSYQKPVFRVAAAAVIICLVVAICFGTNFAGTVLSRWNSDTVDMNLALKDIRSMSVHYQDLSIACKETDINRILSTMDKVRIGRNPISMNRSEDRSTDLTLEINEHLMLNFGENFQEIWVDDGVKASYSYKIINSETAQELLMDFRFMEKDSNTHILLTKVMEVENEAILVAPVEGALELASAALFRVPIAHMAASPEPVAGDAVEIVYEGGVMESYPAVFESIKNVSVIRMDTVFELNFAGNTSMDTHFVLSEGQPYWSICIQNEGEELINMEMEGICYQIMPNTTQVVSADQPWKAGVYSVSFSSPTPSGMHGYAICSTSETGTD